MSEDHSQKPLDPVTFEGEPPNPARPDPVDLRGSAMATKDRSAHRRHHWLYEDLLN